MDNPVIPASGTFGFGYGFTEWFDISILGSIALKGTTLEARYGNPLPRIAECPAGMINAIGLQNPGAVVVRDVELKKLAAVYPKKVIANVGGHSFREYTEASRILSGAEEVFAIELNVSCPNVKGGGMAFGLDPAVLEELTAAVKEVSEKPVVVTSYRTSCGCTSLEFDKQPVPPGGTLPVEITFDSRGEHGWQLKSVELLIAGAPRTFRLLVEADID